LDFMMWNMQDEIVIRFADVLLMAAELGSANAQEYFNSVRNRAFGGNAPAKQATLENIKFERRVEFAFEGLRYHDLLRWHDEVAAFGIATNITVKNNGVDENYAMKFRTETGGFLPIPPSQVRISGGILKQNPGW
ncbi:MAG: RagB/SusD family nutrient uptake outer membrane protein, partial [Bacteroidales bacterium]|nr:RagB/SusD family nutrient uptake outer membrane protein [Bacteroidales bacterium]